MVRVPLGALAECSLTVLPEANGCLVATLGDRGGEART